MLPVCRAIKPSWLPHPHFHFHSRAAPRETGSSQEATRPCDGALISTCLQICKETRGRFLTKCLLLDEKPALVWFTAQSPQGHSGWQTPPGEMGPPATSHNNKTHGSAAEEINRRTTTAWFANSKKGKSTSQKQTELSDLFELFTEVLLQDWTSAADCRNVKLTDTQREQINNPGARVEYRAEGQTLSGQVCQYLLKKTLFLNVITNCSCRNTNSFFKGYFM